MIVTQSLKKIVLNQANNQFACYSFTYHLFLTITSIFIELSSRNFGCSVFTIKQLIRIKENSNFFSQFYEHMKFSTEKKPLVKKETNKISRRNDKLLALIVVSGKKCCISIFTVKNTTMRCCKFFCSYTILLQPFNQFCSQHFVHCFVLNYRKT